MCGDPVGWGNRGISVVVAGLRETDGQACLGNSGGIQGNGKAKEEPGSRPRSASFSPEEMVMERVHGNYSSHQCHSSAMGMVVEGHLCSGRGT